MANSKKTRELLAANPFEFRVHVESARTMIALLSVIQNHMNKRPTKHDFVVEVMMPDEDAQGQ